MSIIDQELERAERVVQDLQDLEGVRDSGVRVVEDMNDAGDNLRNIRSALEYAEAVLKDATVARVLRETLDRLESIPDVVEHECRNAAEALERIEDRRFEELPAVRIRVAARLLEISPPSVYKWIDRGLLGEVRDGSNVRKVSLRDVYEVRPHVQALRALGMKRNLLDAILVRIDDASTLANDSLRASIDQMASGRELFDITPAD